MSNRYVGGVVTETTNVAQSPWSGSWTEQAAMQGFGSVLRIPNSLRFRSSASAYLSRTPSVAGNQKTWTWSGWVKRGLLGASSGYVILDGGSAGPLCTLFFANNQLQLYVTDSAVTYSEYPTTNAVFRDASAWYHCVCAVDTTQATLANRVKFYVNGVLQTITGLTGTLITQNANLSINRAAANYIGIFSYASNQYFDGYMAEVNFVDGQALPPTAFGAINKETGVWAPITYTGTYGLNGFRLNFFNGTSTTTLGYDSSGNGNNWTTNNISLTAGSTYDWMIDSPSKIQGTSYGVGNYAVLSPLITGNVIAPSSGNLDSSLSSGVNAYFCTVGTMAVASGKWYWECSITARDSGAGQWVQFGIVSRTTTYTNNALGFSGNMSNGYAYYNDGYKAGQGSTGAYAATFTTSDVIGVALDLGAGTLTFYKNGTSQGQAFSGITSAESWLPIIQIYRSSGTTNSAWINFGQRPFAYTPPTGYQTLCTQNLPVATIYNGAQYMAATLYTGNGTSQTVTNAVNGVSFTPDFVWNKGRSVAYNNNLVDVIRGNSNVLFSNTTDAEQNPGAQLDITTNGFISTYRSANLANNQSGATYVGWQWKAGGTAVTNTAGTITSSVSANTTAGFSVVTYTGNGSSSATVGHGLGRTPAMVIVKDRSSTFDWFVWHQSLPSGYQLRLNQDYAQEQVSTATTAGGLGTPTSTAFGFIQGTSTVNNVNNSGDSLVAYCFAAIAGYSAFGSFTGNGSNDGVFVFLGFRPRWVMLKSATQAYRWYMLDSSRNTYNVMNGRLFANSSDAEQTNSDILDFVSNGFKLRTGDAEINGSGQTIIYAAFAENPFSVALAR